MNSGGFREYIHSTSGCIGICSIAKLPPTLLFRDQSQAGRAEIAFVDMRREKEQKKERCSNLTGCRDEIDIGFLWQFIKTKSAASPFLKVILVHSTQT